MNIELIQNLLTQSQFRDILMYRANFGRRSYIKPQPFKVYSGLTGGMSASTFRGDMADKRLDSWKKTQVEIYGSVEKADAMLESMAYFGSAVHEALVDIWNSQCFEFDSDKAREMFMESDRRLGLTHNESLVSQKVLEYHMAIASLMQFIYDEVSDILAIETMAICEELILATPIDLTCTLKDGRRVSLNIKTSSQINDHHLNQAAMEAVMWNETYPEYQVVGSGIIRPKSWKLDKVPTYDLKIMKMDEVNERARIMRKKMIACLEDPESSYANFDQRERIFTGKIKLGEAPKIVTKTIEQAFVESQQVNQ
ncbi:MAG: hypothetical protein IPP69_17570 [Flavobacteriales bacterium]|nr:hypothetical protein [Flavobacteriales bacterium]